MSLPADVYSYESRERETNDRGIRELAGVRPLSETGYGPSPQIISCDRPYPYVPYLTAVKVVQDYREGIDCVIRGDDLISEFSLYCYLCERLQLPIPTFLYVPKLLHEGEDLSDVSKTRGNFKIADFRERGFTPDEVTSLLADVCLRNPARGWSFDNIKRFPTLTSGESALWA